MAFTTRPKSNTEAITMLNRRQRPANNIADTSAPTVAQLIDGIINQSAAQDAHNKQLPTAEAILDGMVDPAVGDTFEFVVLNSTGGATITLTTNTGLTLVGAMTIAAAASQRFVAKVTGVDTPAITVYKA